MASSSNDYRQQMEHKETRKNWSEPPTQVLIPSRQPGPRHLMMRGEGSRTSQFNILDPVSRTVAPIHKRPRTSYDGQVRRVGQNDPTSHKFRLDHKVASYNRNQVVDEGSRRTPLITPSSLAEMPNSFLEERILGQVHRRSRSTDSFDLVGQLDSDIQDLTAEPGPSETRKRDQSPDYSSFSKLSPFQNYSILPSESQLRHLDMHTVRKKSRIHQMKDQNGKIRQLSIISTKAPAPVSHNESWRFKASQDPLVASSIKPSPKKARDLAQFEVDASPINVKVSMAYIGNDQLNTEDSLSLTFRDEPMDGGPSISFVLDGEDTKITERDVEFITTTPSASLLFICLSKDGRLYKDLVHRRRMKQRTLEPDHFPDRTLSFKVEGLRLGSEEVTSIINALQRDKRSTRLYYNGAQFWQRLTKSHQSADTRQRTTTIVHQARDKSDSSLTSPEPEPGEADNRPDMDIVPQDHSTEVPSRKTRSTRAKDSKSADNDEIILVYPFTGAGGIQITRGEHHRLEPGGYLNDTLIEFGLRLWIETVKQRDPDLAEQIHIFSPFFYKKLKNKNFEAGYNAVRKWTSKVDIFTKRYLVVPINDSERVHWYLAIILYPENVLRMGVSDQEQVQTPKYPDEDTEMTDATDNEPLFLQEDQKDVSTPPARVSSGAASPMGSPQPLDTEEGQKEAEEVEEELKEVGTPDSGFSPHELTNFTTEELDELDNGEVDESWKLLQDCTYLLIFDSLGGRHPATFKNLKQYLAYEARHKRGIEIEDVDQIQHKQVKSPVQPNYCDCGVYVIQTAQTFLENADAFFQRLMDKKDPLTDHHQLWREERFGTKRQELLDNISSISEYWKQWKKRQPPSETQSSELILELADADKVASKPQPLPSEDDNDSEVEIIGEVSAPKGRVRSPIKRRRGL
ncbi:hypothetical protein FRC20_006438 [Serendipita sp. 405]|nr:hypothetical protein FRC15_005627 [Serendipita sp. 397]KAG8874232.1 hypothetical protein FRC20_006438 [Serendipita sp. 405]